MATDRRRCFRDATLALIVISVIAGCSGDGRVSVEGFVRLDGEPLARGDIRFLHDGNGQSATASIENGRYQCRMVTGKKRVEIQGYQVAKRVDYDPATGAPAHDVWRQVLPEQYNTASELEVDIVAPPQPHHFDLKSK